MPTVPALIAVPRLGHSYTSAMASVRTIEYTVDDVTMSGHLAVPDSRQFRGPRPGVLVSHEGAGQDDNVRSRAERLAALGYVAFTLDYFGGGRQLPLEQAQLIVRDLLENVDRTRRLAQAGLDVLTAQPETDTSRLAAIGFCLGGFMSLELARAGTDLRVVVGFHPGLYSPRPADSANIKGSVLMCCGADDPIIPATAREAFIDEMRAQGVADWRLELYGGVGHSFTNPAIDARNFPGFAYDERADRRSWASMLQLFQERLDST